ncbi:hypothetical protein ACH5RR_007669 [Cinchona calisaya]|uniref:ABC transporter domain-containing protein n=1 Tax=Cinchona calisaya TaxID=153742 RepID=A0ABD3ACY5_9GENT
METNGIGIQHNKNPPKVGLPRHQHHHQFYRPNQRRHLQSNLRLVLFPAILFLFLGALRHFQLKNQLGAEPGKEKWPAKGTPLLLIPAAEFRAVKTGTMPSNDLPDKSCRIKGSCPVTVLITGNNRVLGEKAECVQGLHAWRKNYIEINDELFKATMAGISRGEINEILAAYDFRDSSTKYFDVHMWYNSTPRSSKTPPNEVPIGSALNTVILSTLVYEQQQKLTTMMTMHGLGQAPYWVITYLYFLIICSLYMCCFMGFGTLAGLTFFTLNLYSIQCVFYFVHVNLLISPAFLLAMAFSNVKTASVVGFILVFGSWISGSFLFDRLISDNSFPNFTFQLYLHINLYNLLESLEVPCWIPAFGIQITAERKAPSSILPQRMEKVEQLLSEPDISYPIISYKLQKKYPAQDGNPKKHAVKGLSLAVARGECFGLLGPNGAGKTSFISMVTGLTDPTSGTAYIGGLDLRTQMSAIHASMGVCPQYNLIWDTLKGREHLSFYGRLKNLRGAKLSRAVEDSLRNVNLLQGGDADEHAGEYSGGMKRRLSIAISLKGDPKVVYLDEPSTGLDPASRNMLWDAVTKAKRDRAIILTTHSMEEAEHLCDRIGIFVDGSFQCLGSPDELKDRYGGTCVFTMATSPQNEEDVEDLRDVRLSDVFLAVKYAKERYRVEAWEIADTTLEDVFIKVATESQQSTSQTGGLT